MENSPPKRRVLLKKGDAMTSTPSKEEIIRIVQALPDGTSLDDVIERLILIRKVTMGLSQEGKGIPQSVAEAEFSKPRKERTWNRG